MNRIFASIIHNYTNVDKILKTSCAINSLYATKCLITEITKIKNCITQEKVLIWHKMMEY